MKSQQVVSQQEQMRCDRIALDAASESFGVICMYCVQCTQMNLTHTRIHIHTKHTGS